MYAIKENLENSKFVEQSTVTVWFDVSKWNLWSSFIFLVVYNRHKDMIQGSQGFDQEHWTAYQQNIRYYKFP